MGFDHAVKRDAVFFEGVCNADAVFVGAATKVVGFEDAGSGGRAEETISEARAFFIGPIDERERDRM